MKKDEPNEVMAIEEIDKNRNEDQVNYFQKFLNDHELKQVEAARMLSISQPNLARYLDGKVTAPINAVENVKFLNSISPDEFESRLALANAGRMNDEAAKKRREERDKKRIAEDIHRKSNALKEALLDYVLKNDNLSDDVMTFMKSQISEAESNEAKL